MLALLVPLAALAASASAAVVTVNWNITYVANVNPDGLYPRRAIGVNGVWPPPALEATLGDTLVINVRNSLDIVTDLHAHGLYQNGTTYYDGAAGVTECGIVPGTSFTYEIPIQQTGTYWIHGHRYGQYVDGLRAPLILHPPAAQRNRTASGIRFDGELVVSVSDWYHQEHKPLNDFFLSIFNPTGKEPVPESGLINHQANAVLSVLPGKTYLVRVICMSAIATFNFYIDDHEMTLVEVDGEDIKPVVAPIFPIASAQRYAFLITTKNTTNFNYRIHADMDTAMFDSLPPTLNTRVNGTLQYAPSAPLFESKAEVPDVMLFDETVFEPVVPIPAYPVAASHTYGVTFEVFEDGVNHGTFNRTIYKAGLVPAMYTAMTMGELATNPAVYGPNHPTIVTGHLQGIQIVINNEDTGRHPFHLHGHKFQLVSLVADAPFDPTNTTYMDSLNAVANPSRRDTVAIPGGGHAVLRFMADNPGAWLFHCHVEWHLEAGLAAVIIEAPLEMQKKIKIPKQTTDQCLALGQKISGNAAGFNDATTFPGQSVIQLYPEGFKLKGILALIACIVSAIAGMASVVWYANGELSAHHHHHHHHRAD